MVRKVFKGVFCIGQKAQLLSGNQIRIYCRPILDFVHVCSVISLLDKSVRNF